MKKICLVFFVSVFSLFAQSEKSNVPFRYFDENAKSVSVAGSFNNWDSRANKLTKTDYGWKADIYLPAGYYYYKLVVDNLWITDPNNDWKIYDGGEGFNSVIKVGIPPLPVRKKSYRRFPKHKLPKPVLEDNPDWIELYYRAWELAWDKISFGTKSNGFVREYMDEGFNELIYQWDTCFMVMFALYGPELFPSLESLDNFYSKQRSDGYIQRVYSESNGEEVMEPVPEEPMINPPLFPWIELKGYHITGDRGRLENVYPILKNYFEWVIGNTSSAVDKNLYYTTGLGSGMDNTPREGIAKGAWIDHSAQLALAAKSLSEIAEILNKNGDANHYYSKYDLIKSAINKNLWEEGSKFYFDMRQDSLLSATKHIGAFWTMAGMVLPSENFPELREHLVNPEEFWRDHLVPTLSADDHDYDSSGFYWRGGVWAPTNYMILKGLENYGDFDLAHRIAVNHIENITSIFNEFSPDENKIAFEERYKDGYKTIWECYSPDYPAPATRWDSTFYSRQDFVGWSGLGPIAMLIENVIGLNLRADKNLIIWHIYRDDKHGIKDLRFGEQKVDLICSSEENELDFEIMCEKGFNLEIIWNSHIFRRKLNPGLNIFTLKK